MMKSVSKIPLFIFLLLASWHLKNASAQNITPPFPKNEISAAETAHIRGQIQLSESHDFSNIIVEIYGNPYFSQSPFYVRPNEKGQFDIDFLPSGSSALLHIFDIQGELAPQTQEVSVTNENFQYHISMVSKDFVKNISLFFQDSQKIQNSGICGEIQGLPQDEIQGTQLSLSDIADTKFYSPHSFTSLGDETQMPAIRLGKSGHFCFFNVTSQWNLYHLTLTLKDGSQRTFLVTLNPGDFAFDKVFDATASVYYRHTNILQYQYKNTWKTLEKYHLKTDIDIDSSFIDSKKQPGYTLFPLQNEFLTLEAQPESETENGKYILVSRNSLFSDSMLLNLKESSYLPGQTYTEENEPETLLIGPETAADPFASVKKSNTGHLFFHGEITDTTHEYYVSLLDLDGQEVSQFVPYDSSSPEDNEPYFDGYFLNIPMGIYQLFLYNEKNEISFTSIVHALPNETQFITNKSPDKSQSSGSANKSLSIQISEKNIENKTPQEIEVIPNQIPGTEDENHAYIATEDQIDNAMREEAYKENNFFAHTDTKALCQVKTHVKKFMGFIPQINLLS